MAGNRVRRISAILTLGLVVSSVAAPSTEAVRTPSPKYVSFQDAVPAPLPPGAEKTAFPVVDQSGRVIPSTATPNAADGLWCTPGSGRDNPHLSSTGWQVSGHGWWTRGTCTGQWAYVWNCLDEFYNDYQYHRKACSATQLLLPGGGSSWRTSAQKDCETGESTGWRNVVDVDVVDQWDSSEQPSNAANVYCRVYS